MLQPDGAAVKPDLQVVLLRLNLLLFTMIHQTTSVTTHVWNMRAASFVVFGSEISFVTRKSKKPLIPSHFVAPRQTPFKNMAL